MQEWSEVLAKIAQTNPKKCSISYNDRTEAAAPYFSSVGEIHTLTTGKITDYLSFIKQNFGAEEQHYNYPSCKLGKFCFDYTQVRCV